MFGILENEEKITKTSEREMNYYIDLMIVTRALELIKENKSRELSLAKHASPEC